MRPQANRWRFSRSFSRYRTKSTAFTGALLLSGVSLAVFTVPAAHAAVTWDSQALGTVNNVPDQPLGSGTPWWFDPVNWSPHEPGEAPPHFLPPTDDGTSLDEANIINTAGVPHGEGIFD